MTRPQRGTRQAAGWTTPTWASLRDRQDDQGLVVEATHPPRPGDLPVGIEACHRSSGTNRREPADLGLDPLVSEHAASPDAVESKHAERRVAVERRERVAAGRIGCPEYRFGVPSHDPDQPALRDP